METIIEIKTAEKAWKVVSYRGLVKGQGILEFFLWLAKRGREVMIFENGRLKSWKNYGKRKNNAQ